MKGTFMETGFMLKNTKGKGEGVYAQKEFKNGELVMPGIIQKELTQSTSHSSQIGETRHVLHDGLISKVNHSCDPNCGIKVNKTGAHDFYARRYIAKGEEITFDYAMRNYSVDHFHKKCLCGAENCRGEILGWKSLSTKKKNEYIGFVAPYLLEMDKKQNNS